MKKSMLRYFLTVLVVTLLISTLISAALISNNMLSTTKNNMLYSLKLIEHGIDYNGDVSSQINELNKLSFEDQESRITIIDENGDVIADTYKDAITENHSNRQEIKAALQTGSGYAMRRSKSTNKPLLYVAYYHDHHIVRLAIVYHGIVDQLYQLIPALMLGALVSFLVALIMTIRLARRISKPIIEINEGLYNMDEEYRFKLNKYEFEEFNHITKTLEQLSHRLRKTIKEVKYEQIKLEEILKQMNEGFVLVDENSKVLLINTKAQTLLNEFKEGDVFESHEFNQINDALKNQLPVQVIEIKKDQMIYACYITRVSLGTTLLFVDITDSKKEEKMRREFFSNVSHELKTPLTSVRGYSELLAQGIIQDETKQKEMLMKIQDEVNSMSSLINDILSLSRLENFETPEEETPLKLESIVDEILESYAVEIYNHHITIHKDIENFNFIGIHTQIYTLLNNLIGNAIRYNKDGGSVTIKIENLKPGLKLYVSDTGIGIPIASQSRIFERFYRVDKGRSKSNGGTGLGLAIVKHIVSNCHGTITLHSIVDEGTTFEIILPNHE